MHESEQQVELRGLYRPDDSIISRIMGKRKAGGRLLYMSKCSDVSRNQGEYWVLTSQRLGVVELKSLGRVDTQYLTDYDTISGVATDGSGYVKCCRPIVETNGRPRRLPAVEQMVIDDSAELIAMTLGL